jgi:hypothetical protein
MDHAFMGDMARSMASMLFVGEYMKSSDWFS